MPGRDFEKEIAGMLEAAGAHNDEAVQEAEQALALKVNTRKLVVGVLHLCRVCQGL